MLHDTTGGMKACDTMYPDGTFASGTFSREYRYKFEDRTNSYVGLALKYTDMCEERYYEDHFHDSTPLQIFIEKHTYIKPQLLFNPGYTSIASHKNTNSKQQSKKQQSK